MDQRKAHFIRSGLFDEKSLKIDRKGRKHLSLQFLFSFLFHLFSPFFFVLFSLLILFDFLFSFLAVDRPLFVQSVNECS